MTDKKYPQNKSDDEEKTETERDAETKLPRGFVPYDPNTAASMMCVYAGPEFWNGTGKPAGAFINQPVTNKRCSKCGFPYQDDDNFCSECGAKLEKKAE